MKQARSILSRSFLSPRQLSEQLQGVVHSAEWLISCWQVCPQSTPVRSSYLFHLVAAYYNTPGFVLQNPVGALANPTAIDWPLTPAIIEAKKDNLPAALPQAAMVVASYCKQHEFDHFLTGI